MRTQHVHGRRTTELRLVMQVVCLDLRKFALKADKQKSASGKGKPNQTLEKASEGIMAGFRYLLTVTGSDFVFTKPV